MYLDYIKQDDLGFTKLPDGRYFFRTSVLTALLQCPYKLHFIAKNNTNDFQKHIALIKGKAVHATTSFLIEMYKAGLIKDAVKLADKFIANYLAETIKVYNKNVPNKQQLQLLQNNIKIAAFNFAKYTFKNFKSYITEKTFIIDRDSFVLKLTPDLITEIGIIDYKTTSKPITTRFYIPYDYALQMAIYSYYLAVDAQLLYYSFASNQLLLTKPGSFKNIEERILRLVEILETNRLYKNTYACATCFYRSMCMLQK